MRSVFVALLWGLVFSLGVSSASAKILTYTYVGTVDSGFDQTGDFGTPNTDLAGASFKAVFTFDTAKGISFDFSSPGHPFYGRTGGTESGGLIPVTGLLIINGVPFSNFTGLPNAFGTAAVEINDTFTVISQSVGTDNAPSPPPDDYTLLERMLFFHPATAGGGISTVLDAPNNLVLSSSGPIFGFGSFLDAGTHYVSCSAIGSPDCTSESLFRNFANLDAESLTISEAVPEPATWLMMLLGFAGLALAAYRRPSRSECESASSQPLRI